MAPTQVSRSIPRTAPDRKRRAVAAAAALALVLFACGADDPDAGGPPDGAALYERNCASCHGADVRGTATGPSLLSIVYEPGHHPDESFRRAVRDGVAPHHWDFGAMPIITGMSDDDIEAVIAHVRAAQAREGFEPYPP